MAEKEDDELENLVRSDKWVVVDSLKKKVTLQTSLLSIPLVAAFAWYSTLIFRSTSSVGVGMQLAPTRIQPLVTGILLFIILYGVFLMYFYFHLRKKLNHAKKIIHHHLKK